MHKRCCSLYSSVLYARAPKFYVHGIWLACTMRKGTEIATANAEKRSVDARVGGRKATSILRLNDSLLSLSPSVWPGIVFIVEYFWKQGASEHFLACEHAYIMRLCNGIYSWTQFIVICNRKRKCKKKGKPSRWKWQFVMEIGRKKIKMKKKWINIRCVFVSA